MLRRLELLFCLFLLFPTGAYSQKTAGAEAELRKQADRLYQDEAYGTAVPLYSQLLSLHPEDKALNYRYGVSLLLSGKDKRNAVTYLEKGMSDGTQPLEGWVYLGRAYLFIGKFDDAKNAFRRFNERASETQRKRMNSDVWYQAAGHARELSKSRRLVTTTGQREVNRSSFFTQYDYTQSSGRVLPTAERFQTIQDRDKQNTPVMFIPRDGQSIYYASYGKNSVGGKDLYLIRKMTNGEWAQPENLGAALNSSANEDFPFLDRDGKTLYFASQGHNSIGGYDLFKSVFDFNTGQWSAPENLGLPVNTPDDDILYVPGSNGKTAVYASAEFTDNAHIELRSIQIDDLRNPFATIKGTYYSVDQPMRRDARILVLRASDQSIVTSIRTDPRTGGYELVLPGGEDYWLVVDGGGYLPHSEAFELPAGLDRAALRQEVRMDRRQQDELMTVTNYFTPLPAASDQVVVAVNDEPTQTLSSARAATADTVDGVVTVRFGDEIIRVKRPEQSESETTAKAGEPAPDAADEVLVLNDAEDSTAADKYDPRLEKAITADEIRQADEERARSGEVEAEAKVPVSSIQVELSENELVQMAFDDARELQQEADSLKALSAALYASSTDKATEAVRLLDEARTTTDTVQAAELYLQSDDLKQISLAEKQQAAQLETLAGERAQEAKQGMQDAQALQTSGSGKKGKGRTLATTGGKEDVTPTGNVDLIRQEQQSTERSETRATETTENLTETRADQTEANQDAAIRKDDALPAKDTEAVSQETLASVEAKRSDELPEVVKPESPATTEAGHVGTGPVRPDQRQEPAVSGEQSPMKAAAAANTSEPSTDPAQRVTAGENQEGPVTAPLSPTAPGAVDAAVAVTDKSEGPITQEEPAGLGTGEEKSRRETVADHADQAVTENALQERKQPEALPSTANPTQPVNRGEVMDAKRTDTEADNRKLTDAPTANREEEASVARREEPSGEENRPAAARASGKTIDPVKDTVPAAPQVTGKPSDPEVAANARPEAPDVQSASERQTVNKPTPAVAKSSPTGISVVPPIPGVREEARIAYEAYVQRMDLSRLLEQRSQDLQARIATMKNSPERDSLISVSNNMSTESIRQWQSAQQQLAEARSIEPEIEVRAEAVLREARAALPAQAVAVNEPAVRADDRATEADRPAAPVSGNAAAMPSAGQAEVPGQQPPVTREEDGQQPSRLPVTLAEQPSGPLVDQATTRMEHPEPTPAIGTGTKVMERETPENEKLVNASAQQVDVTGGPARQTTRQADTSGRSPAQLTSGPVLSRPEDRASESASGNEAVRHQEEIPEPAPALSNRDDQQPSAVITQAAPAVGKEKSDEVGDGRENTTVAVGTPGTPTPERQDPAGEASVPGPVTGAQSQPAGPGVPASPQQTETNVAVVEPSAPRLDSTHRDFPRFVALKNEVLRKQDQTIVLFAEGVELNKQASQEKEQQVSLMQQADAAADARTKEKLLRQAELRKRESEEHEAESKKKMGEAQRLTDEIWESNQQLETMMTALVLPEAGTATAVRQAPAEQQDRPDTSPDIPAVSEDAVENVAVAEDGKTGAELTMTEDAARLLRPLSGVVAEQYVVRKAKPAYNTAAPIPMDVDLPEGLVFKVQIGAFRKPIPNEAFGGLTPVSGENTRPGWIRYCVGLFRTFEPANLVKKEMRRQGFRDAFVVAYYNGKRISLPEAYAMINSSGTDTRSAYAMVSSSEMKKLRDMSLSTSRSSAPDADETAFFGSAAASAAVAPTVDATQVDYAVQVGVYRSEQPPSLLDRFQPLQQDQLPRGLFRYTTGRFDRYQAADSMRRVAVSSGIPDAFVVAFRGGRRVSLANARRAAASSVPTVKEAGATASGAGPVSSSATSAPTIVFRVQVGAFRRQVPFEVVDALLKVSDRGVDRETDERGLQIFYAGRFDAYEPAQRLREEIAARGVPDAFVVALSGGKRIPLAEALRRLGR